MSRPEDVTVTVRNGAALRLARRQSRRTLTDLADEVGVSAATLSRAETGRGRATPELLSKCAVALGVDVAALQNGEAFEVVPAGTPGLFTPGDDGAWRRFEELQLEPGLRAAVECFVEFGYHGTSVRDLARVAGVSLQGLYHRYPSKQYLLVAVMEMLMEDFRARCEAARDEGRNPLERFSLLVEAFALFHTYRRELAFIGASEMRSLEPQHRERIAEIRNQCQRFVDHEVEALAAEGQLDTTDSSGAARAVVSMLVGIANWYRSDGPLAPEDIATRYVEHARAVIRLRRRRRVGVHGAGEVSKKRRAGD